VKEVITTSETESGRSEPGGGKAFKRKMCLDGGKGGSGGKEEAACICLRLQGGTDWTPVACQDEGGVSGPEDYPLKRSHSADADRNTVAPLTSSGGVEKTKRDIELVAGPKQNAWYAFSSRVQTGKGGGGNLAKELCHGGGFMRWKG